MSSLQAEIFVAALAALVASLVAAVFDMRVFASAKRAAVKAGKPVRKFDDGWRSWAFQFAAATLVGMGLLLGVGVRTAVAVGAFWGTAALEMLWVAGLAVVSERTPWLRKVVHDHTDRPKNPSPELRAR